MNYLRKEHGISNSGMRGHFASNCYFANTKHLARILIYLNEINKAVCVTTIRKDCNINGYYVRDAIRFLLRYEFIVKCHGKRKDGGIDSTKLYKIKEEI